MRKWGYFRKSVLFPYIIIVTYKEDFFNVFSPDFSIFLNFSYARSPCMKKTPFWGIFEGKKDPFFGQMGWYGVDKGELGVRNEESSKLAFAAP